MDEEPEDITDREKEEEAMVAGGWLEGDPKFAEEEWNLPVNKVDESIKGFGAGGGSGGDGENSKSF